MALHKNATGIHAPHSWTFADSTERTAVGVYATGDVGKFARQVSDNSVWMLTAVASPGSSATPTWTQVNGTGGGGGGGGGLVFIGEEVAASNQAALTVSSISGSYKSLWLEWVARSTDTGAAFDDLKIEFNADTTATNYYKATSFGGDAASNTDGNSNLISQICTDNGSSAPAGHFDTGSLRLPDYAHATRKKSGHGNGTLFFNTGQLFCVTFALWWVTGDPITQIDLRAVSGNLKTGSSLRVWGLPS